MEAYTDIGFSKLLSSGDLIEFIFSYNLPNIDVEYLLNGESQKIITKSIASALNFSGTLNKQGYERYTQLVYNGQ